MTSPTQAVLDQLAGMKLDKHVPKRPTPNAVKVRYVTGWRVHLVYVLSEDVDAGTTTIWFHDSTLGIDREKTVESRRLMR